MFLTTEFDQSIWHCQDLDFTMTCNLGSPRKKNPKHLYNSFRSLQGFSMAQEGEDCFSRTQPEAESDTSRESVRSRLRWVDVPGSWDRLCQGAWQLVRAGPRVTAGPALVCDHGWTDGEVSRARNHTDLLITALWKQARAQKILKQLMSLIWELWACNELGKKSLVTLISLVTAAI